MADLAAPSPATKVGEPPRARIGLALSGGGFRAAFFHVGVLARLAEARILHKVEVISTVSGGSIVGVAYYLKVKRLLERPPEGGPSAEDFIILVSELDRELRAAVSQGIRGRLFANMFKNLWMLSPPFPRLKAYTHTDRLGDLLDRYLYKDLFWRDDPELRDERIPFDRARRDKQIELRDLVICPDGEKPAGKPREVNAGRSVKIPELVVNATCLNTGHLWSFEATRMGEHSPGESDECDEVPPASPDGNRILRQGYFVRNDEEPPVGLPLVPPAQQNFPMALAVAASAAVPGAFSALPITGMYKKARVQLVDGGVADNQGVQSLRDHHCTRFIVSDGSGQMLDQPMPRGKLIRSATRTLSVQGDRIRDLQLLAAGPQMHLVHLRDGLTQNELLPDKPWEDPTWPAPGTPGDPIHPETLDAISRIRTDLDTFTGKEINALECSGYLQIDKRLSTDAALAALGDPGESIAAGWDFKRVEVALQTGEPNLTRHLLLGRSKFFRFLLGRRRLMEALRATVVILAAIGIAWFIVANRPDPLEVLFLILLVLVAIVALTVLLAFIPFAVLAVYRGSRHLFGRVE